ncbi:MAG: amylosucrase [Oscillospiraceae bacterium]|nr:amylosucrase [Oscillospiraceae bacterium]
MGETIEIDTFQQRYARHADELRWLFMTLYPGDEQAFFYFQEMLRRSWEARSPALRALDEQRLADPAWYKGRELLGMLMYADAFAGTLQGVREKLDYVQDCGVNYLHLMPLLESPAGRSDGGYAVSDFRKVQPELGTMEDLAALAADCHGRGIALCLDFVMNHTSEEHEWARRARAGDRACQERYFFYDDWTVPFQFEQTVPQVFPTTAPGNFTWCSEAGKVVMTTFYPYQWDLNYANPVVFNDMTENMLFLCNQGVDVIRLDAVPYIWKELGTNCRNLPQVHTLVRIMRMVCEIVCPGALLLGEVVMEPSRVVPYFGTVEKPECHLLYNVTTMASIWHTVATKDVRLLQYQLGQVFALPREYSFLNYLRCHDDIGWGLDYGFLARFGMDEVAHKRFLNDYLTGKWPGSPARGELYNDDPRLGDARLCGTTASLCGLEAARYEKDEDKLRWALRLHVMLHALILSLSGIPVLYSGDEIARENDYTYHQDSLKADDSRFLHRGNMDWQAARRRKEAGTVEHKIFTALRRLETLRRKHRVFDDGADVWLLPAGDPGVLGIGRYRDGEKLLALFNFSEGERTVDLSGELGDYRDLWTGRFRNKGRVTIPSGGFAWLLCRFADRQSEKEETHE